MTISSAVQEYMPIPSGVSLRGWDEPVYDISKLPIYRPEVTVEPQTAWANLPYIPKGWLRDQPKINTPERTSAVVVAGPRVVVASAAGERTLTAENTETSKHVTGLLRILEDEQASTEDAQVSRRNRRVGLFVIGYGVPVVFDAVFTLAAAGDMVLDGGISTHATRLWLTHNAATTAVVACGNIAWLTGAAKINGYLRRRSQALQAA